MLHNPITNDGLRGADMGIIRKTMSMSTLGAVDYRSDKERTAAYTKGARKQAKKQTAIMQDQAKAQQRALAEQANLQRQAGAQGVAAAQIAAAQPLAAPAPAPSRQGPPPGWYPDQADQSVVRWFDGAEWTGFTQPKG